MRTQAPISSDFYKLSCTEILGSSSYSSSTSLYVLTSSFHIFHLSHLSGTLFSTFLLRFRVVTSAEVAASKTSSGMLTAFLLLHKEKKKYIHDLVPCNFHLITTFEPSMSTRPANDILWPHQYAFEPKIL